MIRHLGMAVVAAVLATACSGGGEGPSPAEFCAVVGDPQRFGALFESFDPENVAAATATLESARAEEAALRAAAPAAVRADLDLLIEFLDDLLAGLSSASPGPGQRPAIYEQLRPRFDQVEAAGERIDLYVIANC